MNYSTRTGGYSYVDPNGKKISVKYTAGKEGFKILEADHLPKAPQPVAPLPAPQQPQPTYSQVKKSVLVNQPTIKKNCFSPKLPITDTTTVHTAQKSTKDRNKLKVE